MATGQKVGNRRRRLAGQTYVAIEGIAEYCMVSRSTVGRWINDGKLSAMRLPSGRFRVSLKSFRDFLKSNNMPITQELLDS